MPTIIIKHLNELKEFECFVKYEKEIIHNLIDIIRFRKNQMALINKCHEDYFLNLNSSYEFSIGYKFYCDSDDWKKLIKDFKNILSLVTAIDLFEDKDLIFTKLFDVLNNKIDSEINRKNKILIENKKFWEELKKDIQDYWTNTKNDIDKYKNKISIYKFQLQQRIVEINEISAY